MDALIGIIQKEQPGYVFFPVLGVGEVSKHKRTFEKYTKLLIPDYDCHSIPPPPPPLLKECHALNIGCPCIYTVTEASDILEQNCRNAPRVKVVLKPRKNLGASEGIFYVDDPSILEKIIGENQNKHGKYTIQEYIPGRG